jgi:hypothetical protein
LQELFFAAVLRFAIISSCVVQGLVPLGANRTFAQLYGNLTGKDPTTAWQVFIDAVRGLRGGISSDDPFGGMPTVVTALAIQSRWCRMEVALAKRARRPMVVLDALFDKEPRSSPFLADLPSIRISAETLASNPQLERVANFIALEVLRFLHAQLQLRLLKEAKLVSVDSILLPRQPELSDIAACLNESTSPSRVFVHPDPSLSAEESEDYAAFGATFTTPIGICSKKLVGLHLEYQFLWAMRKRSGPWASLDCTLRTRCELWPARQLAAGATLVYGGALGSGPGQFHRSII